MSPVRSILLLAVMIFLCSSYATALEHSFDPRDCPSGVAFSLKEEAAASESLPAKGIRLYQRYLSPVIGERCQMYPSCSEYSISSIKKHGVLIGIVMTFDRFIREIDEADLAPTCNKNDRIKFYDPVEENDFWWADRK